MRNSISTSVHALCALASLTVLTLGCADPCHPGSTSDLISATTTAEVKALLNCTSLGGRVIIAGNSQGVIDLETIEFPNLVSTEQDLTIRGIDSLLTLSFPKLKQLSSDRRFGAGLGVFENSSLRTLSAPQLEFSGLNTDNLKGGINVANNPALTQVVLSSLKMVPSLNFQNDGLLTELSFPSLEFASFAVQECGVETISLPKLTGAGALGLTNNQFLKSVSAPLAPFPSVDISGNPELLDVDLSGLTKSVLSIQGSKLRTLKLDNLTEASTVKVVGSSLLKALSAPKLANMSATGSKLEIRNNAVLEDLNFPLLTEIAGRSLLIDGNPNLPDCEALLLYDQVGLLRAQAGTNKGDGC